jgi:hypothetical protein
MSALAVPPASTPSTAVSALSLDRAKAAPARGVTVPAAADSIGVHRSKSVDEFSGLLRWWLSTDSHHIAGSD